MIKDPARELSLTFYYNVRRLAASTRGASGYPSQDPCLLLFSWLSDAGFTQQSQYTPGSIRASIQIPIPLRPHLAEQVPAERHPGLQRALGDWFRTPRSLFSVVASRSLLILPSSVTDYAENPLLMDYYGFPPELYQLKFKSRGESRLAQRVVELYKQVYC